MRKLMLTSCLGMTAALAGAPAMAEAQWYVGGAIGSTSVDVPGLSSADVDELVLDLGGSLVGTIDVVSDSTDDSDTGFKVYGGVDINEYVGVEVLYANLGEIVQSIVLDVDLDVVGQQTVGRVTADAGYEANAIGAAAVVRVPFNEQWGAFAKLGFAAYNVDAEFSADFDGTLDGTPLSFTDFDDDSDSGTGVLYGVGGTFQFHDNWRARVEWERYALEVFDDDIDVDLISGAIEFVF